MDKIIKFLGLIIASYLTACATPQLIVGDNTQNIQQLDNWQMSSVASLSINRSIYQFIIDWNYTEQQESWQVREKFSGRKVFSLQRKQQLYFLSIPQQKTLQTDNPQKLILTKFRVWLPLLHMGYWLRSLPSPSASIRSISYDGHLKLTALEQAGWKINWAKFKPSKLKAEMPHRIIMQRGDNIIKFAIINWSYN